MDKLLIIEDELPMRVALTETLQSFGYRVITANDGTQGLKCACSEKPDLILLDVMMPDLDGYAVCRELRHRQIQTPVLMLTGKAQIDDRVEGLDAGADDYLIKPFSMKELLARVRALLRRGERAEFQKIEQLRVGGVDFDFLAQTCSKDGEGIAITAKELRMMQLLAERRGQTVSRDDFLDIVWEYNAYPSSRTVDNYIASLRAKVESDQANPCHIITVRSKGYRLICKTD